MQVRAPGQESKRGLARTSVGNSGQLDLPCEGELGPCWSGQLTVPCELVPFPVTAQTNERRTLDVNVPALKF